MREYEHNFMEGLQKGLRTHHDNPANEQALVECYNTKPSPNGLVPYDPITDPLTGAVVDWPFPQLFIGSKFRILATDTKIYELASDWSATEKIDTTESGAWDFIDFGSYFILVNGAKIVALDPSDNSYSAVNSSTHMPRFATGCNFKGQIVAGNIKTTWHGCGVNSVIWSNIGSASFTPGIKNEAGFRHMLWEGEVLRVKRLGDIVMIYGDNEVAALVPVSSPAVTFGMKEIIGIGIPCKTAIGGDEHNHVFVDTNGWLWKVTEGQGPKKLGYQEFMTNLTASKIVVSYDPGEDEFFISDDSTCYVLTPHGLCEGYQLVTTVAHLDGATYGVFTDTEDYEFRVKSDTLDFGVRGFKTLSGMDIGLYHPSTYDESSVLSYGSLDIRSNHTNDFAQTVKGWIKTNNMGNVTPQVTAEEFRLRVKVSRFENVKLNYIRSHVKVVDRRTLRGVYALQAKAESELRGGM